MMGWSHALTALLLLVLVASAIESAAASRLRLFGRAVCGENGCENGENCQKCPQDCGECTTVECGDGVVGAGEQCDDGNLDDGDGCSSSCQIEDGGPDPGTTCPVAPTTPVTTDSFDTAQFYASDASSPGDDWESSWDDLRSLVNAFDVDPHDVRCTLRGNGDIHIRNGIAEFVGSPRLYVSSTTNGVESAAWNNLEFTAYGNYFAEGTPLSYSGLTMAARSKHSTYKENGCHAAGYYARIYLETGEVAFQKEYYHPEKGSTIYTNSVRLGEFSGGLPLQVWIGMKFVVYTEGDSVRLELYLDMTDGFNGGEWTCVHSLVDEPGSWLKNGKKTIPGSCQVSNGDPVVRPGTDCFLRSDGDTNTVVQWKKASLRNILV